MLTLVAEAWKASTTEDTGAKEAMLGYDADIESGGVGGMLRVVVWEVPSTEGAATGRGCGTPGDGKEVPRQRLGETAEMRSMYNAMLDVAEYGMKLHRVCIVWRLVLHDHWSSGDILLLKMNTILAVRFECMPWEGVGNGHLDEV